MHANECSSESLLAATIAPADRELHLQAEILKMILLRSRRNIVVLEAHVNPTLLKHLGHGDFEPESGPKFHH
jgi:hypothetical protein